MNKVSYPELLKRYYDCGFPRLLGKPANTFALTILQKWNDFRRPKRFRMGNTELAQLIGGYPSNIGGLRDTVISEFVYDEQPIIQYESRGKRKPGIYTINADLLFSNSNNNSPEITENQDLDKHANSMEIVPDNYANSTELVPLNSTQHTIHPRKPTLSHNPQRPKERKKERKKERGLPANIKAYITQKGKRTEIDGLPGYVTDVIRDIGGMLNIQYNCFCPGGHEVALYNCLVIYSVDELIEMVKEAKELGRSDTFEWILERCTDEHK